MMIAHRTIDDPTFICPVLPGNLPSRLYRKLLRKKILLDFKSYNHTRPDGCEPFTDDRSEYGASLWKKLYSADIINLHWVSGFIDYFSFFETISDKVPVVWTFHDMNAFTGGCHYDFDCGKFISGCGACPQLGSNKNSDISRQIWQRKHKIFKGLNPHSLTIVAPSKWLLSKVRESPLLGRFKIVHIPYGLDVKVFMPRNRHVARDLFDIPHDKKILLFLADDVSNHRKGFKILMKTLNALKIQSNICLVSVGREKPDINATFPHIHLGFISDDRLLSLVYSAADLFLIPSLQDNLPNTVIESLACGTPVVGFYAGGIPDMVRNGITGCLVPCQDADSMERAIIDLLSDTEKLNAMETNCRRIASEEYSLKKQALDYSELYETILSNHQKKQCLV
ncbi:MAG: glycosyltransferase [bacterium]